jgi:hypothetical protein
MVVNSSWDLRARLIVGVPVSLYFFGRAIYGFIIASNRDSSCIRPKYNKTILRNERLDEILRKSQKQSQQELTNTYTNTSLIDPDPHGFFEESTGKLKD